MSQTSSPCMVCAEPQVTPAKRPVAAPEQSLTKLFHKSAKAAGLSAPGLLLRTAAHSLWLLPSVFTGRVPAAVKLQFLPMAALYRVLKQRIDGEFAGACTRRLLFALTVFMTRKQFRAAMATPTLDTIKACFHKTWRTAGKHQKVGVEVNTSKQFQFVYTECMFTKALTEFGLPDLAIELCAADRFFWSNLLNNSEVVFTKAEKTLACGGTCCRIGYHLK